MFHIPPAMGYHRALLGPFLFDLPSSVFTVICVNIDLIHTFNLQCYLKHYYKFVSLLYPVVSLRNMSVMRKVPVSEVDAENKDESWVGLAKPDEH